MALTGCSRIDAGEQFRADPAPAPIEASDAPAALAFASDLAITTAPVTAFDVADLRMGDPSQRVLVDLLHDGLVEVDPVSGELVPAIATSWSADADAMTWTFEIDTERAASTDVAASLDAVAEQPASPAAIALSAVETIDALPGSVTISLTRPDAGLPWVLAGVPYSIVRADGAPTGRYRLGDVDDLGVTLLPIDPADARVTVWFEREASERASMLAQGTVDAAVVPDPSQAGLGSRHLIARGEMSDVVDTGLLDVIRSIVADEPGADAVIVDRSIVPTGFPGDRPMNVRETPADAAAVVASFGRPLVVAAADDAGLAMLDRIAESLASVGLVVETRTGSPVERIDAWANGEVDLLLAGWLAPAATADASVWPLLGPGSSANLTGWSGGLDDALAELDDERRWDLLAIVEQQAIDDGVIVPVAHSTRPTVSTSPSIVVRADGTFAVVD